MFSDFQDASARLSDARSNVRNYQSQAKMKFVGDTVIHQYPFGYDDALAEEAEAEKSLDEAYERYKASLL